MKKNNKNYFENLVNTSNIFNEPINRWFSFKESYSIQLVEDILNRYDKTDCKTILDPFMGAGSTILKSFLLGKNSIGFDVNPIGVLATDVKTTKYNKENLIELEYVTNSIHKISIEEFDYPKWKPMERYIKKDTLNVLMSISWYINNESFSLNVENLLKLLWLSIIEEVSDYKKDGNGIKYRKRDVHHSEIIDIFIQKIDIAINDIKSNYFVYNYNQQVSIFNDSSMNINNYLNKLDKIDAIITSPPYANCFDYFEVYKVELWMGGFIQTHDEWKKLKKSALRNNINSDLSKKDTLESEHFLFIMEEIQNRVEAEMIRDKNIPVMLHNYFYDLQTLLSNVRVNLNNNAIVSIIVGNSAYGGKVIPTDEIIIDIAENLNYTLLEHIVARPLRTSSQQMKIIEENEKPLLRESIITFQF